MNSEPTIDEIVQLAAVDNELFTSTFFTRTFRQRSPELHRKIWDALDNPSARRVLLRCFRGSAKTTILRAFIAKRVAYNISRTIFFLGASDGDATRTIQWLRNQVERNHLFASTFALRPGRKWNENEIEIIHGVAEEPIWVLAAGITGSVRGVNFDDYRPDLIVLDDCLTDETAATADQRDKLADLILGAIDKSLAPKSEEPNAKLAMAQTPLHQDDASARAAKSPAWLTVDAPCWTPETMHLPIDQQVSAWPERWSSEEFRAEKREHIRLNKLSLWNREMEVRLTSPETSAFRPEWLRIRDRQIVPGSMYAVIAIDPVPPPSQHKVDKDLHNRDFECIAVLGRSKEDYHVLEYRTNRGHEPNWTYNTTIELALKWRIVKIVYEAVNYQKTLGWGLREHMKRTGIYFPIMEAPFSKISKYHRILNSLAGVASSGHLLADETMSELVNQWNDYPRVSHDDVLDAVAIGIASIVNPFIELGPDDYRLNDDNESDLVLLGRAP